MNKRLEEINKWLERVHELLEKSIEYFDQGNMQMYRACRREAVVLEDECKVLWRRFREEFGC